MKIIKSHLRKIIKEEVQKVIEGAPWATGEEYDKEEKYWDAVDAGDIVTMHFYDIEDKMNGEWEEMVNNVTWEGPNGNAALLRLIDSISEKAMKPFLQSAFDENAIEYIHTGFTGLEPVAEINFKQGARSSISDEDIKRVEKGLEKKLEEWLLQGLRREARRKKPEMSEDQDDGPSQEECDNLKGAQGTYKAESPEDLRTIAKCKKSYGSPKRR